MECAEKKSHLLKVATFSCTRLYELHTNLHLNHKSLSKRYSDSLASGSNILVTYQYSIKQMSISRAWPCSLKSSNANIILDQKRIIVREPKKLLDWMKVECSDWPHHFPARNSRMPLLDASRKFKCLTRPKSELILWNFHSSWVNS